MSRPFDASLKHLVQEFPMDWLRLFGWRGSGKVDVVDADLSSVTAGADKVLKIGGPVPWILHLEFQTAADPGLAVRLLRYNVLLHERFRLPVQTILIALRPDAAPPGLDEVLRYESPLGGAMEFHFRIWRAWGHSPSDYAGGGLGTLALAPLGARTPEEAGTVLREMKRRLAREGTHEMEVEIFAACYILLGLKFTEPMVKALMEEVSNMEESSTYRGLIAKGERKGMAKGMAKGMVKGREAEIRELILGIGKLRFGPPPRGIAAKLSAISDLDRLRSISKRLVTTGSWREALAEEPKA